MSRDDHERSRMLDLYREARAPDSAVQSRVWRSVEATIGPVPAGPTHGEPAAGAAPASGAGAKLVALVSLIALGGGLAWLATAPEPRAPAQLAPRALHSAPAEVPASQAAARPVVVQKAAPASGVVALEAAATAAAVDARPPAAAKPRAGATTDATSTLAEELKLVASAQAALQAGRDEHALGLLRRHGRRFPAGALSEEREATLVEVLCALGRKADAATAAARFVARFPGSPRSSRVRDACVETAQ